MDEMGAEIYSAKKCLRWDASPEDFLQDNMQQKYKTKLARWNRPAEDCQVGVEQNHVAVAGARRPPEGGTNESHNFKYTTFQVKQYFYEKFDKTPHFSLYFVPNAHLSFIRQDNTFFWNFDKIAFSVFLIHFSLLAHMADSLGQNCPCPFMCWSVPYRSIDFSNHY